MKAAIAVFVAAMPFAALAQDAPPPAAAPTLPAHYSGEDLAYCSGMLSKLRELDPGMVSVIPASVNAMLSKEASARSPAWKLGVPVKAAAMRGAGDARALMRQQGALDFGKKPSGLDGPGGGIARCWLMVQPFLPRK